MALLARVRACPAGACRADDGTLAARGRAGRGREHRLAAAVDELRPYTQAIWRDSDIVQCRRFLRHLRPWWDVHRHRIAPQVAETVAAMRARGQLEVVAGKLVDVTAEDGGARVAYRRRGERGVRSLAVRRIVNRTGPQGDVLATCDPLLKTLLGRGLIRPGPLRIGIDVDARSQAIDRDGRAQDWLLALGPVTRGAFWEIVAVPDIRQQTWVVARQLSDAVAASNLQPLP